MLLSENIIPNHSKVDPRLLAESLDRTHHRSQSLVAFALYFTLAILLLDRGLVGHPDYFIGRDTDPPQTMWFFNWWRFSLAHGLNPFITDWVWAPLGMNLAWTTFVPLPALISIPLQVTVGEPDTYNIIITCALPLAAFSAFLLCRRITRAFWPSVLGGYLFGFSSYMLAEVLAHLDLVAVFPAPLVALVTLKRLDGEISARRFAILLAALLTVQFLCFPELFATITIVGGFALLLAHAIFEGDVRARLAGLILPAVAGYAIAGILLSPYLFYMLAQNFHHAPIYKSASVFRGSARFPGAHRDGNARHRKAVTAIAQTFQGDIYEDGAYLGIAIIVFVAVFCRLYWREPVGKFLTILFVNAGDRGDRSFAPYRWAPRDSPCLGHCRASSVDFGRVAGALHDVCVPGRGRDGGDVVRRRRPASTVSKWWRAAIIVASIAPNPHASFWVSDLDMPAFFTDRTYATELEPREIILPLPWGQKGNSMYWQVKSDMYFRMAGGWTGASPFEFERMPVANYFYGGIDLPEAADQLKAYIARFGVQAVIADPIEANFAIFKQTLDSLGVAAQTKKACGFTKSRAIRSPHMPNFRPRKSKRAPTRCDSMRSWKLQESISPRDTISRNSQRLNSSGSISFRATGSSMLPRTPIPTGKSDPQQAAESASS